MVIPGFKFLTAMPAARSQNSFKSRVQVSLVLQHTQLPSCPVPLILCVGAFVQVCVCMCVVLRGQSRMLPLRLCLLFYLVCSVFETHQVSRAGQPASLTDPPVSGPCWDKKHTPLSCQALRGSWGIKCRSSCSCKHFTNWAVTLPTNSTKNRNLGVLFPPLSSASGKSGGWHSIGSQQTPTPRA